MTIKNKATQSERDRGEVETEESRKLQSTFGEDALSAMDSEEIRTKDSSGENESDVDRQLKFVLKRQWDMINALAKSLICNHSFFSSFRVIDTHLCRTIHTPMTADIEIILLLA